MITSAIVGDNLSIGRAPGGSTSATATVGVVLNGTNNLNGTLTVGGTTIFLANASAVNDVSTIDALAGGPLSLETLGPDGFGRHNVGFDRHHIGHVQPFDARHGGSEPLHARSHHARRRRSLGPARLGRHRGLPYRLDDAEAPPHGMSAA